MGENKYYVAYYGESISVENISKNISLINADPSSFSKLKNIMSNVKYSNIFIVMENIEDARYSLKNIRLIDDKVRVILVNQWDDDEIGKDVEIFPCVSLLGKTVIKDGVKIYSGITIKDGIVNTDKGDVYE
jgi:bifunctional N-acetylglucosamine-1-phosphate-uridyltransferase/glucosamine-1-phosphate-acetyltransferase GlmU-like protein